MDTRHPADRSGLFSDPDDIWYLVDYEPIVPQEQEKPKPKSEPDEDEELPF